MRFVIRENFNRRHLSTGQKAMLATKLATLKHGGDRKSNKIKGLIKPLISSQITIEEAATITGASKDSIKRAKAIVAADPELAAKIEANTMSLNAASVELEEKKSTITSVDPKLWNDVVESKTPIQEALDVANKIAAAKKKEQEAERKKRAEEAKKIAEEEKRKKLLEKQRAERERLEKLAKANMTREEALRVFGIYVDDPGARITKEALTILYRGFAKLHHPDSNGGTQSDAFIEVKAAYESLLNNERAIK